MARADKLSIGKWTQTINRVTAQIETSPIKQ